mgnify:CR=1 FL=1|jgi:hypothetical protein
MLDIATSYNKYKFLGNEFLTWIWFLIETQENISSLIHSSYPISIEIGNSINLENHLGDKSTEQISIKGDQAGLEEGTTALKKGAWVTQINLILKIDQEEYKLTLKGESLNITGLKPPKTETTKREDEIEGMVLEKTYFCFGVVDVIDTLFLKYIEQRTSDTWHDKELKEIRKWVES